MPRSMHAMEKVRIQTEADNAASALLRNPPAPVVVTEPEPEAAPEVPPTE